MKFSWPRLRVFFASIVWRMTLILFAGLLVAQFFSAWIWNEQLKREEVTRLHQTAANIGTRMGQTLNFFLRLPQQYRHVVLDQLRDMGGTRFFVSVNREYIQQQQLDDNPLLASTGQSLIDALEQQSGEQPISLQFVVFDQVRVLSATNTMVGLPPKWQRFAILSPADKSPVVVVQLPINDQEWMYLATVFPAGESLYGQPWFTHQRVASIALVLLTVLVLTTLLVRWVVRPLRLLARESDRLGRGAEPQPIREQGSTEMQAAIRAFNTMSARIRRYVQDRERLFVSISHDLKTPLTRARLRTELIDDPSLHRAINNDLDNLSIMVKSALQMLKEGAIHENLEAIDLNDLLRKVVKSTGEEIPINLTESLSIEARPLALQRLLDNLVENALDHAKEVEIFAQIVDSGQQLQISVMDRGPGIDDKFKQKILEPYTQLPGGVVGDGHVGLGLGIARDLAQLHGGELSLHDRDLGGLEVRVTLPL